MWWSVMSFRVCSHCFFFFKDPASTEIYPLSLHDALPILLPHARQRRAALGHLRLEPGVACEQQRLRSEEHTSELQSHVNLVCRLLLEKKKNSTRNCTSVLHPARCHA